MAFFGSGNKWLNLARALHTNAAARDPWHALRTHVVAAPACGTGYSTTHDHYHATTILVVKKDSEVVMIGDGQVTMGNVIAKPNAKKVRKIGDSVVAGFAGSAADGLSLLERLEVKLEEHPGQLLRAAVELAKVWRQDKALRFLQAELLVADKSTVLNISGNGDVVEPHDGVMAIGSGGNFAVAAARALIDVPGFDASTIATKAMNIAADMCIHTNHNFVKEVLKLDS